MRLTPDVNVLSTFFVDCGAVKHASLFVTNGKREIKSFITSSSVRSSPAFEQRFRRQSNLADVARGRRTVEHNVNQFKQRI